MHADLRHHPATPLDGRPFDQECYPRYPCVRRAPLSVLAHLRHRPVFHTPTHPAHGGHPGGSPSACPPVFHAPSPVRPACTPPSARKPAAPREHHLQTSAPCRHRVHADLRHLGRTTGGPRPAPLGAGTTQCDLSSHPLVAKPSASAPERNPNPNPDPPLTPVHPSAHLSGTPRRSPSARVAPTLFSSRSLAEGASMT